MSKKRQQFLPVKIKKVCAKKAISAYLFIYFAKRNVSAADAYRHDCMLMIEETKRSHMRLCVARGKRRLAISLAILPYAMHKRITIGTIAREIFFKKVFDKDKAHPYNKRCVQQHMIP